MAMRRHARSRRVPRTQRALRSPSAMRIVFAGLRARFAARRRDERGLALIFVLSLTGVILALLSEILFQSQITVRTSVGERDKLKAEMSALTGAQFAKMLIGIEAQISSMGEKLGNNPQAKGMVEGIQQMIKSQLGGKNLSQILDGFPIGAQGFEEIQDLAKININALLDEKLLAALKAVPGYFVIKTTNESGKFNLNLSEGSEKKTANVALKRIFGGPRELKWLQDKGLTPERLAANVIDYIDRDNSDEVDRSDESLQYTNAKLEHGPKNGKLESLEELRRIPGFQDDEIFNVFSPYFTVWPLDAMEKSLDVNYAPVELLAALRTQENQDVNDGEYDQIEDKRADKEFITQDRDISQTFKESDSQSNQIVSRLFGIRSTVYRVEVRGVSNGIERTYTMVVDLSKKGRPAGSGAGAAPTPTPVPGAGTPPQAVNPLANNPTGGTGSTAGGAGGSEEPPMRIVYQRFQ